MAKSAVIIGGGLGGLFTGAILSKEGVSVTVIEKNATIGGGLQSFTRFGEVFDTGMHVISGMQKGGSIRRICEYLGIFDKVHVRDVDPETIDELYFAEDKKLYRIAQGKDGYIDALAEVFPDQRENMHQYVDAMFRIVQELDLFQLRPSSESSNLMHSEEFMISAKEFIARYITNERLRSIVAYINPLYGGRGDMTPAYIHCIVSTLYINGPSRFAGGSDLFANSLRDAIVEHGGQVIVGDGVEKVYSADKQITHVVTHKGKSYSADYYICAIHPCAFLSLLDDSTLLPKAYRNRLEEIPNSYSAFVANLKLKPGKVPYVNHTSYYMSRYDEIWNFGESDRPWPLGFLYMTPPEIEQGEYSTKMILTAPMTWNHVKQWEDTRVGHRGESYETWKQQCTELLLDRMEEIYPNFRDCVEAINSASPLTIRDYYAAKEGTMCGYSKDYKNMVLSHLPVVTKAKNLLLTGQNNNLHGFCGVPLTAIQTSEVILGQNYVLNKINNIG